MLRSRTGNPDQGGFVLLEVLVSVLLVGLGLATVLAAQLQAYRVLGRLHAETQSWLAAAALTTELALGREARPQGVWHGPAGDFHWSWDGRELRITPEAEPGYPRAVWASWP